MASLDTRATVIVAAVVVAIGALPIYAGVSRILEHVAVTAAPSEASAEVVAAERLWLRDLVAPSQVLPRSQRRSIWEVTYEFKTAGGAVVRSTGIYTTTFVGPRPGEKMGVRYHPDDPRSSYLEDRNRLFDAVLYIGLGLFLWLVAGVFVWWEVRRRA